MNRIRLFMQRINAKQLVFSVKRYSSFEPEYLQSSLSQVPTYDVLNIQMKGYDYPVLENYQKFVHKLAENMGVEVEDSWALPPKNLHVKRLKQQSAIVETEYKLNIYERNIQVVDLPSTVAPIFFYTIQESLPEGVKVTIHPHKDEHEEIRYVPDAQLLELKSQLDTLGGPSKKRS